MNVISEVRALDPISRTQEFQYNPAKQVPQSPRPPPESKSGTKVNTPMGSMANP